MVAFLHGREAFNRPVKLLQCRVSAFRMLVGEKYKDRGNEHNGIETSIEKMVAESYVNNAAWFMVQEPRGNALNLLGLRVGWKTLESLSLEFQHL